MVLLIHAENGEVKAKKYQYVKKGDVLISGFISKDDKIVKKERAEGYKKPGVRLKEEKKQNIINSRKKNRRNY